MGGFIAKKGVLLLCADTAMRWVIGVLFIHYALDKLDDPGLFQVMVGNYRMLPAWTTAIFSATLPMAELLVGGMFIITKWTREAAFATAVMLLMFIVALGQAQIRGLDISCGCSMDEHTLVEALVRDLFMLLPTMWLLFKGQHRWIADFSRIWYTERK